MSKQRTSLSGFTGNGNVISFIPTRKVSHRVIALVIVIAVLSLAAASGTRPDVAGSQNSTAVETAANPNARTEFVYFPGQYVNQGTELSEPIATF